MKMLLMRWRLWKGECSIRLLEAAIDLNAFYYTCSVTMEDWELSVIEDITFRMLPTLPVENHEGT